MAAPSPLPYDLVAATEHLLAADRRLARLIERVGPCRLAIEVDQSPYEALVEAIVYQQLHARAAAAIYGRLCAAFGGDGAPRAARLATAAHEDLRAVGLSRAKALAVQDLAQRARARQIPTRARAERMSDEELVECLTAVRGVGRWTVEMLLLFTLGRPDVLPVDDLGVRRGAERLYGRSFTPKELGTWGARWAPWRSAAAWHLWRVADAVLPE